MKQIIQKVHSDPPKPTLRLANDSRVLTIINTGGEYYQKRLEKVIIADRIGVLI